MYVPPAFAQTDQTKLFDFIEAHSFGLLVSGSDDALLATHLPLLVDRAVASHGRIVGHMARANVHWQSLAGREALCIFSGPHAYISPTWYEDELVVPTWNYLAVHAYGTCRIVDETATARIVADYVTTYERSLPAPWKLDAGTQYFEKLLRLIVGFEIDVRRLEGKWKLGQNHSPERREKVARQLAESADINAQEIGRLMRSTLERDRSG